MSLDYNWFSTMWGVYIFRRLRLVLDGAFDPRPHLAAQPWLPEKVVTDEHYHLMGKLLFAFTVFWAYIAFSQYFLIWYANITEETRFYLTRNTEGWRGISIFIVVGHFVGPFLLLLSQPRKKNPVVVSLVCLWIIFMHLVDIYWNIIPERGPPLEWAFGSGALDSGCRRSVRRLRHDGLPLSCVGWPNTACIPGVILASLSP
jgi:hypothetical protein